MFLVSFERESVLIILCYELLSQETDPSQKPFNCEVAIGWQCAWNMQNAQGHGIMLSFASQIINQSSGYEQDMSEKGPCKVSIVLRKNRGSHWQNIDVIF